MRHFNEILPGQNTCEGDVLAGYQTGRKPLICLFREGIQLVQDNLARELIAFLVSTFRKKAQPA